MDNRYLPSVTAVCIQLTPGCGVSPLRNISLHVRNGFGDVIESWNVAFISFSSVVITDSADPKICENELLLLSLMMIKYNFRILIQGDKSIFTAS